jgi:hypothetical protein
MKLNVNHTLELTDEQTVINGEKRLGRELKKLFIRALEDLARGERVALGDYDLDEKLEEILQSPEARRRAISIIDRFGGPPAHFPGPEAPEPPDPDECPACEGTGGTFGVSDNMDILACGVCGGTGRRSTTGCAAGDDDDEDDNVLADDEDETAEIPTVRTCLRCEQEAGPEEPGMCEDCKGFIHTKCRAEDLGELIEERGPMPAQLRGVDPETGEVGNPPYLCGRCTVARLERILADQDGSDEWSR